MVCDSVSLARSVQITIGGTYRDVYNREGGQRERNDRRQQRLVVHEVHLEERLRDVLAGQPVYHKKDDESREAGRSGLEDNLASFVEAFVAADAKVAAVAGIRDKREVAESECPDENACTRLRRRTLEIDRAHAP